MRLFLTDLYIPVKSEYSDDHVVNGTPLPHSFFITVHVFLIPNFKPFSRGVSLVVIVVVGTCEKRQFPRYGIIVRIERIPVHVRK